MATVETLPILDPDSVFGRGGFGELYSDPRDPLRCIKVLKSPLVGEEAHQLLRLVDVVKWAAPSDVETLTSRFDWPVEAFGSKSSIVGFTMPRAPESTRFELAAGRHTKMQDLQAKFLMDASYWRSSAISSAEPHFSTADRVEILLDLIQCVLVLHRNGLTYGDISSNNVAIRAESSPGVFLFDADSITVPSERVKRPIVSPGWEVPDGLGPLEIDLSRVALFAVRLLEERPSVYVTDDVLRGVADRTNGALAHALKDLFVVGEANSIDVVKECLIELRDARRGAEAFNNAVESGFASWVLRESAHAVSAAEKKWVALAESQVLFEYSVRGMSGRQRRSAAYRDKLQRSHFVLDVPPIAALQDPPSTVEALKDLIYETMFEELAGHLVLEGLGALEGHGWLHRAVDRALIEARDPELLARVEPGKLSLRFWWPVEQFVNAAEISVTGSGLNESIVLRRGDAESQLSREVLLPDGGEIQLRVRVGSKSPVGESIWSSRALESQYTVEGLPRPARPRLGQGSLQLPHVAAVIDPEQERQRLLIERLRLEQEEADAAEKRRRLRQRRALSIAVAAIVVLVVVGLFVGLAPFSSDDVLDEAESAADDIIVPVPASVEIGSPRVVVVGSRAVITWQPPMDSSGDLPLGHKVFLGSDVYQAGPYGRLALDVGGGTWINPTVVAVFDSGSEAVASSPISLVVPEDTQVVGERWLGEETGISVDEGGVVADLRFADGVVSGGFILRWYDLGTGAAFSSTIAGEGAVALPVSGEGLWRVSAQYVDAAGRPLAAPAHLGTVSLGSRAIGAEVSSLSISPISTVMRWSLYGMENSAQVYQVQWSPVSSTEIGSGSVAITRTMSGTRSPSFVVGDDQGHQFLLASNVIVSVPDDFLNPLYYGVDQRITVGFDGSSYFVDFRKIGSDPDRSYELVFEDAKGSSIVQPLAEGRNAVALNVGSPFNGEIVVRDGDGSTASFELPAFTFVPIESP